MADAKMVAVAFLLIVMLVASSAPAAEGAHCVRDCYARCANGKVGDTSCHDMCVQACIIPTSISTDGSVNFGVSLPGGGN